MKSNMEEKVEKIYKFLKENKIETIQELIDYKLGKKEFNNPDGIEVEIESDGKTSLIYVLIKYKKHNKFFHNNSGLHSFLIDNMPREELGKLLLVTYIKEHAITSSEGLINCIYDGRFIPAYMVGGFKEDIYLNIEFGKEFKVKRAYFAEGSINTDTIEIDIDDFYSIISNLPED